VADTATVRLALAACACTHTGKAAAGSTQRCKQGGVAFERQMPTAPLLVA